jgi:hypothetical protein
MKLLTRRAVLFEEMDQTDLAEPDVDCEEACSVFMFPGPDGQRPIDLARQCNITRQATCSGAWSISATGPSPRKPCAPRARSGENFGDSRTTIDMANAGIAAQLFARFLSLNKALPPDFARHATAIASFVEHAHLSLRCVPPG